MNDPDVSDSPYVSTCVYLCTLEKFHSGLDKRVQDQHTVSGLVIGRTHHD